MIADWYESDEKIQKHVYGHSVAIKERISIFVPVRVNLQATIEASRPIRLSEHAGVIKNDLEPPGLFWDEYLIHSEGNKHVFETNYCRWNDKVLSLNHLDKVPGKLREEYVAEVPDKVHEIADRLAGGVSDTIYVLKKFFNFCKDNLHAEFGTNIKPIETLVEEYESEGKFRGSCKETRDFMIALCNARGIPAKRVAGKSLGKGGHVWPEIFVPVDDGYRLLLADPASLIFGEPSSSFHLYFEHTPEMPLRLRDRFKFDRKKDEYNLKIEWMK